MALAAEEAGACPSLSPNISMKLVSLLSAETLISSSLHAHAIALSAFAATARLCSQKSSEAFGVLGSCVSVHEVSAGQANALVLELAMLPLLSMLLESFGLLSAADNLGDLGEGHYSDTFAAATGDARDPRALDAINGYRRRGHQFPFAPPTCKVEGGC